MIRHQPYYLHGLKERNCQRHENDVGDTHGDEGVQHLSRLKSLYDLSLNGTDVTNAALAELAAWPNLRYLGLSQTAITSAGVEKLAGSSGLTQ